MEAIKPKVWKESETIPKFIIARWRKGLANLIAVIGPPGTGKSYVGMRLAEVIAQRTGVKFGIENVFSIADDKETKRFISFLRSAERGTPMIIEEASVLFNSRRFMSKLNVNFNKILDTVRKKGIVLILNYPHFNTTDIHIERMVNLLIETRVLYKSYNACLVKPMILQTDVQTGKTYRHKLVENGIKIDYSIILKPNEELCKQYEASKDKYLDDLYNTLEEKGKKDEVMTAKKLDKLKLAPQQQEIVNLRASGLDVKAISKKLGLTVQTVYHHLKIAKRKVDILNRMKKIAEEKQELE
jgi:DNA-binding CsgD family transcriptional regulator